MSARGVGLLAIAVTFACGPTEAGDDAWRHREHERLSRVEASSDFAAASVGIPELSGDDLTASRPGVRVLVTFEGITIDRSRPALARWRAGSWPTPILPPAVPFPVGPIQVLDLRDGVTDETNHYGQGILVTPLLGVLEQARDERARDEAPDLVELWIAPSVPYVTVARVIWSAAAAGWTRASLMAQQGSPVGLPLRLRPSADRLISDFGTLRWRYPPGAWAAPTVRGGVPGRPQPTVTVEPDGIMVEDERGVLANGCTEIRQRPAPPSVPRAGRQHDWVGLSRCLQRVHDETPANRSAILVYDANDPYQDLPKAFHTLRGQHGSLFPDIALGVTAR